jgi:hypothetical protein
MRELDKIVAAYSSVDAGLEAQRDEARRRGDSKRVTRIEQKQLINDHAYFVLCFGQLEAAVDDACRTTIRSRSADADWGRRRGWDIYNPEDRRLSGLSFEDRVALLTDKKAGPRKPYARIVYFYGIRNTAAHGKFEATRIDIPAVAVELRTLVGLLVR